jgi:hypothetical protein
MLAAAAVLAVVGLPDVPMMWPMYRLGVVFPSCGLTRGIVAIFRGEFGLAWRFNPASFVAAVGALALAAQLLIGRHARWTRRAVSPMERRIGVGGVVAAVVLLWIHQQVNADFVIHGRL